MITPTAWATLIAVRALTWNSTRSTATTDGENSATRARISVWSSARRTARSSEVEVRRTPTACGVGRGRPGATTA